MEGTTTGFSRIFSGWGSHTSSSNHNNHNDPTSTVPTTTTITAPDSDDLPKPATLSSLTSASSSSLHNTLQKAEQQLQSSLEFLVKNQSDPNSTMERGEENNTLYSEDPSHKLDDLQRHLNQAERDFRRSSRDGQQPTNNEGSETNKDEDNPHPQQLMHALDSMLFDSRGNDNVNNVNSNNNQIQQQQIRETDHDLPFDVVDVFSSANVLDTTLDDLSRVSPLKTRLASYPEEDEHRQRRTHAHHQHNLSQDSTLSSSYWTATEQTTQPHPVSPDMKPPRHDQPRKVAKVWNARRLPTNSKKNKTVATQPNNSAMIVVDSPLTTHEFVQDKPTTHLVDTVQQAEADLRASLEFLSVPQGPDNNKELASLSSHTSLATPQLHQLQQQLAQVEADFLAGQPPHEVLSVIEPHTTTERTPTTTESGAVSTSMEDLSVLTPDSGLPLLDATSGDDSSRQTTVQPPSSSSHLLDTSGATTESGDSLFFPNLSSTGDMEHDAKNNDNEEDNTSPRSVVDMFRFAKGGGGLLRPAWSAPSPPLVPNPKTTTRHAETEDVDLVYAQTNPDLQPQQDDLVRVSSAPASHLDRKQGGNGDNRRMKRSPLSWKGQRSRTCPQGGTMTNKTSSDSRREEEDLMDEPIADYSKDSDSRSPSVSPSDHKAKDHEVVTATTSNDTATTSATHSITATNSTEAASPFLWAALSFFMSPSPPIPPSKSGSGSGDQEEGDSLEPLSIPQKEAKKTTDAEVSSSTEIPTNHTSCTTKLGHSGVDNGTCGLPLQHARSMKMERNEDAEQDSSPAAVNNESKPFAASHVGRSPRHSQHNETPNNNKKTKTCCNCRLLGF